jgi:hypothetical protein
MFGFARWVYRNKVVALGGAVAVAILTSGNRQPPKPTSAWAASPPVAVNYGAPQQPTVSQTAAKALTRVAKTVGVEKMLPSELIDQSKGNFEATDQALKSATNAN